MNKGFLNCSSNTSKDVDNDLIGKGSLLGDLASKIRNINGKILGRDGKPMVARRCVRFSDTTKESVCGDVRMVEPSSQAVTQPINSDYHKCMVHKDDNHPELRRTCTTVTDSSSHTNDVVQNISSAVSLPKEAIDEIKARFVNTLYGFPFDSKSGMEKVMEGGPWRIQLVPIILKVWMPNTLLKKEKVSNVPLWVKMHNVPIVAYSKVGLDLISAKVGRLMRLDAHTNFICLNSWGRSDYARALVEVSADKPLVDSIDIDIPRVDGKGHTMVNVRIEFEWQPPRCCTCKIFDHLESVCPMIHMAGLSKKSDMQADTKLVYRAVVKPQGDNNVTSNMEQSLDTTKKPSPSDSSKNGMSTYINDDVSFDELRNFVDKTSKEESVLEFIRNNGINGCISREKQGDKVSTKKSSSSMEFLNEDSDTDVDEVFLPNDGIPFPSSSVGGGQPLEDDMLNAYDAYEDQFEEYPSSYQEFCDQFDFKVKGLALFMDDSTASGSNVDIAMREFRDCIEDIEVLDVQCTGFQYTWNQKPKGMNGMLKKLDHVMANIEFNDHFVGAHAIFKPYHIYDHSLSVLCILTKLGAAGNLHANVSRVHAELDSIQTLLDAYPFNVILHEREASYVVEFNEAVLLEECFLKQKAKIQWLKEGDSNSAYFHKAVKSLTSRSRIDAVTNSEGVGFENDRVPNAFVAHYESFLGIARETHGFNVINLFNSCLNEQEANDMVRNVTAQEVK
ncbi:hypothetical protein Tco_1320338 [Tanacetum coccineum]